MTIALNQPKIDAYAGRTEDFEWAMYDYNGSALAIDATDVVRFKLSTHPGSTPVLDLDSTTPTANGSVVTISQLTAPASGSVRLAQADTASLRAQVYYWELTLVDDSETDPANAIKVFGRGQINLLVSPGGSVSL